MDFITADTFIQTLFPDDLVLPDERAVIAWPDSFVSRETGQRVDFYRQVNYKPHCMAAQASYYYCVSTVWHQRQRQVKKALKDVRRAFVLVVDDVGTKSAFPPVAPSYSLETSAGNYQIGYLLEPFDVATAAGQDYYDGCLLGLANAGFNDPGFRSATRLARVPGSVHKSGFTARVASWSPERTWELEDLMAEMGVGPVKARARKAAAEPGKYSVLSDTRDPLYYWLADLQGCLEWYRIYGASGDWVHITCPWRHNHTDGHQGPSSTVFSPYDYGSFKNRAFKCSHGHCAGLTIKDFEEWAQSLGADTTLPSGDSDLCDLQLIIPNQGTGL